MLISLYQNTINTNDLLNKKLLTKNFLVRSAYRILYLDKISKKKKFVTKFTSPPTQFFVIG